MISTEQEIHRPKHEVGWERVKIPPNLSFPTDSWQNLNITHNKVLVTFLFT